MAAYFSTLAVNGVIYIVEISDKPLPNPETQNMMPGSYSIATSYINSRPEELPCWIGRVTIRLSLVGYDQAFKVRRRDKLAVTATEVNGRHWD